MTGELRVEPTDLVVHAGQVEAIADALSTARQAGDIVRIHPEAYGKLCLTVPMMLDVLHDILIGGMDTAVDSARGTARQLRTVAENYQSTDATVADHIEAVGSRL